MFLEGQGLIEQILQTNTNSDKRMASILTTAALQTAKLKRLKGGTVLTNRHE